MPVVNSGLYHTFKSFEERRAWASRPGVHQVAVFHPSLPVIENPVNTDTQFAASSEYSTRQAQFTPPDE
jgi:hypothetical protein